MNVEELNLRQFFYKELSTASSPLRKNQLKRANTKHFQLTRKPTRVEDIEHIMLSADRELIEDNNRLIMAKPISQPRLQSMEKQLLDKRLKHFHLYTNNMVGSSPPHSDRTQPEGSRVEGSMMEGSRVEGSRVELSKAES